MLARQRTFSTLRDCFGSDEFGADAGSAEQAPSPVKPNESGKQASQVD
jgi:hypothetical protein